MCEFGLEEEGGVDIFSVGLVCGSCFKCFVIFVLGEVREYFGVKGNNWKGGYYIC